jgi:hypothetical protein
MANTLSALFLSAESHLPVFRHLTAGIPYERKGILNSEMSFLWLCAQAAPPKRILESGRARGQSTLILARCFPDTEIVSVERYAHTPDALVAAERLKNEANVRLLFGDAARLLPALARPGDVTLIDGPKGLLGVRLVLALLASTPLDMVFVHDTGPGTAGRLFLDRWLSAVRYSSEPRLVRHSHALDDEEAMEILPANRFLAGGGGGDYGYSLACIPYETGANYSLLRLNARVQIWKAVYRRMMTPALSVDEIQ